MTIAKNSIVTLNLNNTSSNTFIVDTIEENSYLLSHPLAPGVLVRVEKDKVNLTSANIKDSSERGIDYANLNRQYLDYNTSQDLDGLAIVFALKRKLTLRQKTILSQINGVVAKSKFNDDIRETMSFIKKNVTILDDFNLMWYNNLSEIFNGNLIIKTVKQRNVIFNIAGYLLAEMENPTTKRGR
jgi:hypothetical protein